MELHEGLLKYVKFGLSMRTANHGDIPYYVVSLTYPTKWIVSEPEDDKVSCLPSSEDGQKGTYFYFTPVEHGIAPIFDSIESVVGFNEELELKSELLRKKATELNELFTTEPYEKLLTLRFEFVEEAKKPEEEPKKRGRKPGQKNKVKKESKEKTVEVTPGPVNIQEEIVEPPMEDNAPEVAKSEPGTNMEEASEIDKKIAMAMGKF